MIEIITHIALIAASLFFGLWLGRYDQKLKRKQEQINKAIKYEKVRKEALEHLRNLHDVQNDTPLEQWREEWEVIMHQVQDFLKKHE